MKLLLISDDENFTKTLSGYLNHKNLEIIVYKWLMKALDNIEEIKPDIIILSTSEYPRHWKTLVQFTKSSIGSEKTSVFLYEPKQLSDDDQIKVEKLNISGTFSSLDEIELNSLKEKIFSLLSAEKETIHKTGKFIFTHPVTQAFITGTVEDYFENAVTCKFDSKIEKLDLTDLVKYFTFYTNNESTSFSAIVSQIDFVNNKAIFTIKDFYEE